ncbi:MAG: 2-dehydropantoate 2-reductase [Myxococcales bacterium]|jgi:2-dehydropantoate 2-reductase|nr:2-dehydropantoate 2-reductase [Myxococcales bacterium]
MGAGAIGCYVGGCLAADGAEVVFVGRARAKKELETSGLVLSALDGGSGRVVPKERIAFATEASALAKCDVVLCCVKSAQSAEAANELAAVLAKGALVVSMQNGVRNADVLRAGLPEQIVLGGIVGFNVVSKGEGAFRRATSGPLVIEKPKGSDADNDRDDARLDVLVEALAAAGFEMELVADIRPLQWSKLIMNLNNAVGALSDRPTPDLLFVEGYRRILRAIMTEAIAVLRAAKEPTARLGPLPIGLFPILLRLPTPVLRVVASAQVKIDPEARSSMWEDLTRGRPTEVDHLNGEIVRLAESCGAKAPLNARMVEIVHDAEKRAAGSPKLDADALWSALNA